jgi:alkylation response protein AidB-like acyl-CoA dehydrogenase
MATAVESGYAWLDRAGKFWTQAAQATGTSGAHARLIAIANAARVAVESSALEVLEDAERSVGASGMISPHPLERNVRDLRTYLRQPNPDGALASLGSAIAGGTWSPGRSFNEIN